MALKVKTSKASTLARGTKHTKGSMNAQHSMATKVAKKSKNGSKCTSNMEF